MSEAIFAAQVRAYTMLACIWLFISVCLNWRPVPLPVFLMQCLRLRGIVQPGLVPKNQKQNQKVAETLVFMLDAYVWTIASDNHYHAWHLRHLIIQQKGAEKWVDAWGGAADHIII